MQAIERIRAALNKHAAAKTLAEAWMLTDEIEDALSIESLNEVLAHIDALTAENERLRKDADRYRWLRKTTNWVSSKGQRINVRDFPKSWDEHIDDAMKGTP